jgi:hypothetical protein
MSASRYVMRTAVVFSAVQPRKKRRRSAICSFPGLTSIGRTT